jgi:predicted nuclease of restriction endonuclease-like (RecB) superfamily
MADDRSDQDLGHTAGTSAALPFGYHSLLDDIRARIELARARAALVVNRELILLYWEIGGMIVRRQERERWGRAVVARLATDIQTDFPGVRGFSSDNFWRMRAFWIAWHEWSEISGQPVPKLEGETILQQAVGESADDLPPAPLTDIPWGHNILLLQKLKDPAERLWYAHQTVANGWSRSTLQQWIESGLYSRQGGAVTNFAATLPGPQSDVARQLIRDPYSFDFLGRGPRAAERDVERGLVADIRRFLLELGSGFAFVGQQVHLVVDGEDFYIDLLFYHLRLRCFVVVELKAGRFRPEHAGKLNFYLSVVDDRLRHADDRPSIGLILCRTRGRLVAEYALRDIGKPIGVSRFVTTPASELPSDLRGALPSPEQFAALLGGGRRGEGRAAVK